MSNTTTTGTSTTSVDQASDPSTCRVTGIVLTVERRFTIQAHDDTLLDSLTEGAFSAAVAEYAVSNGYTCRRDGSTLFDLFAGPNTELPQDKGDIRVAIHVIVESATNKAAKHATAPVQFKTTDEDVDIDA